MGPQPLKSTRLVLEADLIRVVRGVPGKMERKLELT